MNFPAKSETPLPSVFPPSFNASKKNSVATVTANIAGYRCVPIHLRDAEMWKSTQCTQIPPKRVQNVAAVLRGVEVLSWPVSPPQRSLVSQL